MGLRLLHTADWQLGMRFSRFPGDTGAKLRLERFEAVRRIASLAKERAVDCVVVAGDVFEDNLVGDDCLEAARDVLRSFAPIPVLLLPGNHDAAVPGGAIERATTGSHGLAHVVALLEPRAYEVAGAVFYACPLYKRQSADDPTGYLFDSAVAGLHRAEQSGPQAVRVVVAHGSVLSLEGATKPNTVNLERLLEKGFDYVALGDWHGVRIESNRAAYSGTPEATRFKEKAPGFVLVVDIDGPGTVPKIAKEAVSRMRWVKKSALLRDQRDLRALASEVDALPERSMTLLRLEIAGSLSPKDYAALEALVEHWRQSFLVLDDRSEVMLSRDADAVAALARDPVLQKAAELLKVSQEDGAANTAHDDALVLLLRIVAEQSQDEALEPSQRVPSSFAAGASRET